MREYKNFAGNISHKIVTTNNINVKTKMIKTHWTKTMTHKEVSETDDVSDEKEC